MKLALRVMTVTSVAALWLASAGCGSSPHGGATILGTVTNASTQRFQVRVEGTNISTATPGQNQVRIRGVIESIAAPARGLESTLAVGFLRRVANSALAPTVCEAKGSGHSTQTVRRGG